MEDLNGLLEYCPQAGCDLCLLCVLWYSTAGEAVSGQSWCPDASRRCRLVLKGHRTWVQRRKEHGAESREGIFLLSHLHVSQTCTCIHTLTHTARQIHTNNIETHTKTDLHKHNIETHRQTGKRTQHRNTHATAQDHWSLCSGLCSLCVYLKSILNSSEEEELGVQLLTRV